jgi:hypothetical protein
MAKKPTKKVTRQVTSRRRHRGTTPAPPTVPPAPTSPTADAVKARPVARFHRANASPAQRRGAALVRYLRIHLKAPYGDRGIRAIEKLAREVAHLANLELNARDAN